MISREWQNLTEATKATIGAHQGEAPVKLSSIARSIGVDVFSATLSPGISGEIRPNRKKPGRFIIRVNRHDPSRRQRFTIAHEIAHFLLHKEQVAGGIEDDVLYRSALSDRREAEANRLAADILMPQELIDEWLKNAQLLRVEDVVNYLSDRFEVSEASMKIRLGLS